jgi:hypothetical protein
MGVVNSTARAVTAKTTFMTIGIKISHKKIGSSIGFYGYKTVSTYPVITMTKLRNKPVVFNGKTLVAIVNNHKVISGALIFYKRKNHVQI